MCWVAWWCRRVRDSDNNCVVCMQDGRTALHLCAAQGHVSVIRDLLRKGADPTQKDAVSEGMVLLRVLM